MFAEELRGINLISGTNKIRVKLLHEILERAYAQGDLPTKFYAVVDADTDEPIETTKAVSRFEWDVYHIENYLLVPSLIAEVLNSMRLSARYDDRLVLRGLSSAARNVVPGMLTHRMRTYVNSRIVSSIDLGFSPANLRWLADRDAAQQKRNQ